MAAFKHPVNQKQWSKLHRNTTVEVDLLHAHYTTHAYPRHVHDYYVIGFVKSGTQCFSHNGWTHTTPAGGLILLNPDEAHTGEAASDDGFGYQALYPTCTHMAQIFTDVTGRDGLPFFSDVRVDSKSLASQLRQLHSALANDAPALEAETRFVEFLAALIMRYAETRSQRVNLRESIAVQRAREYIEAHHRDAISLEQLAAEVGLSQYHFLRCFRAETGIPPHAYLESVRIRYAQNLLAQQMPPAQIAYALGFSSQGHFGNRFKRIIGVTPGQYAAQHAK